MGKTRFLTLALLVAAIMLVSCRTQTPVATQTADVESTTSPLLASSCQVALIGKWEEEDGVVISIRNFAGDYQITRENPDGSNTSMPLGVNNVDGVVRFYEDALNLSGSYWTIGGNRSLEYYDGNELIKSLPIAD